MQIKKPDLCGFPAILAIILSGIVAGCGNQNPGDARDLLHTVQAADYRSWDRAPGYETRQPSNAPHSSNVDIYLDDLMAAAVSSDTALESWPVGSVVVKDGFKNDELRLIAMMEKRDSGWFFAEFDGDGDVLYSGSPRVCTKCHGSANDRILAFSLPGQ